MNCPRCSKTSSYPLTFTFKVNRKKIYLEARVCKVCEYLYAEDEDLLKTARRHLKELAKLNDPECK